MSIFTSIKIMGLSLEYLTILMKTFKRSFEFLIFIMDHAILNQIDNPICDLEWNNFVYESIINGKETVVPANYIALLEK
jgi:hypothetical protein